MGRSELIRRSEQSAGDPCWRNLAAAVILRARRDYTHKGIPAKKNSQGYVPWMIARANGFACPTDDVEAFLGSDEFEFWIDLVGIDRRAVENYIRTGQTVAAQAIQHKHKRKT